MAIIGALAVTLALGWIALVTGMFALMAFGGFDEVNIPAGIAMTIGCVCAITLWWIVVGTHISISIGV